MTIGPDNKQILPFCLLGQPRQNQQQNLDFLKRTMEKSNFESQILHVKTEDDNLQKNFQKKDVSSSSESSIFLESEEDPKEKRSTTATTETSDSTLSKNKGRQKKYHNIPNDLRMRLIEAVDKKGERIKHAARKLSINYSSAKSICQVFKKEGRTNKKSSAKNALDNMENALNLSPSIHALKDNTEKVIKQEEKKVDELPVLPSHHHHYNLRNEEKTKNNLVFLKEKLLEARKPDTNESESHEVHNFKKMRFDQININNQLEKKLETTDGIELSPLEKQIDQLEKMIQQNNSLLSNHQITQISSNLNVPKGFQSANHSFLPNNQNNPVNQSTFLVQQPQMPIMISGNNGVSFANNNQLVNPINPSTYFMRTSNNGLVPLVILPNAMQRQQYGISPVASQPNFIPQSENLRNQENQQFQKVIGSNPAVNIQTPTPYYVSHMPINNLSSGYHSSMNGLSIIPTVMYVVQPQSNSVQGMNNLNPFGSQPSIANAGPQNMIMNPPNFTIQNTSSIPQSQGSEIKHTPGSIEDRPGICQSMNIFQNQSLLSEGSNLMPSSHWESMSMGQYGRDLSKKNFNQLPNSEKV